jgi:iron complex transport system ATP-binding protein
MGIPFAAGVLHENDLEYPTASALASAVITEKAFEPICQETYAKACEIMEQCNRVICCLKAFGTMNQKNCELMHHAASLGNITEYPDF